jgi:hypothetical protein
VLARTGNRGVDPNETIVKFKRDFAQYLRSVRCRAVPGPQHEQKGPHEPHGHNGGKINADSQHGCINLEISDLRLLGELFAWLWNGDFCP